MRLFSIPAHSIGKYIQYEESRQTCELEKGRLWRSEGRNADENKNDMIDIKYFPLLSSNYCWLNILQLDHLQKRVYQSG